MPNPPRKWFALTKPTVHSRYKHTKEGMLFVDIAKISSSVKIAGMLNRLIQYWRLISLRTPRPLALLETRRCHRALAIRGSPRIRLATQTADRVPS